VPPLVEDRLRDIPEAVIEIEDIMRGVDFDRFASDRRTRLLTERLLEILCEASRAVPEPLQRQASGIDWRKMIDFGNLLRHACHATNAEVVWDVIQDDLPALKSLVERHIRDSGEADDNQP
jgi:uncharacterized protein with HEPN domain